MRRNHNPLWYKLTKLLKGKGKISTGLTLPYLFGAYKLLDVPILDVATLLDEIRINRIDKYPVIQKCDTIHQHVVAVEDKNLYNNKFVNDVKLRNSKGDINLIISLNTDLGRDDDAIYKKLIRLYKGPIDDETFSWNNNKQQWDIFSDEEIDLIKNVHT